MPTFYNFTQNGVVYNFDDVFVPADWFRDGNLWAWGRGTEGQLGTNDFTTRGTPSTTFAGGTNWKQVSSGYQHTAAIKTDGTLWTWGRGNEGQLGNAAITNRSTPVTTFSGGTNWKQVSAGGSHTLAIKTDGTLWSWGIGTYGRLGNANTTNRSTPVTTFSGGNNWKQVECASSHTAAIKTDGTLWTWGSTGDGQLGIGFNGFGIFRSTPVTTFSGGTNWKQVSGGIFYTAAIKTDGTLWIWGDSGSGRLGNAVTNGSDFSTPVTTFAGGTNWKQVSAGGSHTAAIKTDGTLWVWGQGTYGKLGLNFAADRSTPTTTFAGGNNWKQVSCGNDHTTAVKTDGTLWTWGIGTSGRLGINDGVNRLTPVTTFVGGTNWKQVDAGHSFVSALTYQDPGI
jgi:alpha-tubulin suppressor-like RCC1 family protein